jgi:putative hydrolases of HD superfamily
MKKLKSIANFLYEVGILSKTPRSGFHFLGSGEQSVAEHTNRVVYAGYVLATLEKNVDVGKVMKMCLFHDLAEARTSDLNYVHQKYVQANEESAITDLTRTLGFGDEILAILTEHKERKSKEALLAKDADIIDWILSLKEQVDIGNSRAESWLPSAKKRLKTQVAKNLAEEILQTNSDEWWFADKDDDWWVHRDKKTMKKRF